jgi:hypothetical protein
MKQNTITALLAVIAVLLAANLAASVTRPASAQNVPGQSMLPAVRAVGITQASSTVIYRLWSDGTVERNVQTFGLCGDLEWCGWETVPG